MIFVRPLNSLKKFFRTRVKSLEESGYPVSSISDLDFAVKGLQIVGVFDPVDRNIVLAVAMQKRRRKFAQTEDYVPLACLFSELGASREELSNMHARISNRAQMLKTQEVYRHALDALLMTDQTNSVRKFLFAMHAGHVHPFLDDTASYQVPDLDEPSSVR